jgi:glycerol-3-phosphate dehydrogenase
VTAVPVSSASIAESVVTPQGTTADASAVRQRSLFQRRQAWTRATTELFDAAVVGAGINGATVYHELCQRGYRVLLLDRADFGGATSQASGMMIWGGILYLAQFDVQVVRDFCVSRDRLIQAMPSWVKLDPNRYVFRSRHGRGPLAVGAGLFAYWLLGGRRRARPRFGKEFPERSFLRTDDLALSILYEEAAVRPSDARFVAAWIFSHDQSAGLALNHCGVLGGSWDAAAGNFVLEIDDRILDRRGTVRAASVINAAGCWTDEINSRFGIWTPWKHLFSKGVFIGFRRYEGHHTVITFENRTDGDCMALIPWGPISLWGATETLATNLEASYRPEPEDIRFLLGEWNRQAGHPRGPADIVSLRTGVRPLAVPRNHDPQRLTLSISRRSIVYPDRERPWISMFGGKITGCDAVARSVAAHLAHIRRPSGVGVAAVTIEDRAPRSEFFPGLAEPLVAARHAAEHEMCWTLDDYLRRRTNVSQWVARRGLGVRDENLSRIRELAAFFSGAEGGSATAVERYREQVGREHDAVLAVV